jgi:hypothetical protein
MPLKPHQEAVRIIAIAATLLWGVAHAEQSSSNPAAVKLDKTIQDLKNEALQFNREATTLERDTLYPAHSRVSLYLGVRINNFLIKEVNVSFDNGPVKKISYDDKMSRALFQGSNIDRLLYANISPGSHRVHLDYIARYDGKDDAPPITGSYDAFFDKNYNESELEIVIAKGRSSNKPAVALKEWRRVK